MSPQLQVDAIQCPRAYTSACSAWDCLLGIELPELVLLSELAMASHRKAMFQQAVV